MPRLTRFMRDRDGVTPDVRLVKLGKRSSTIGARRPSRKGLGRGRGGADRLVARYVVVSQLRGAGSLQAIAKQDGTGIPPALSHIIKTGSNSLPQTQAVAGGTMRLWWQSRRTQRGEADRGPPLPASP